MLMAWWLRATLLAPKDVGGVALPRATLLGSAAASFQSTVRFSNTIVFQTVRAPDIACLPTTTELGPCNAAHCDIRSEIADSYFRCHCDAS